MAEMTEYSQTQRIVLLIDLNPLLRLADPDPYLSCLLSAAETLLFFPPLSSSSLFSFKLFFSSLSPLLSSSKLSLSSLSLSFDRPAPTFHSLSQALTSLLPISLPPLLPPRAIHVAASMGQLLHDYAWDSDDAGTLSDVKPNLIVLFSQIPASFSCLSSFFGAESNHDDDRDDGCLRNLDAFVRKFREVFGNVNEAFVRKDILFSWVDVKRELGCSSKDWDLGFWFFRSGFRDLGWGFCSSDSIVLGSSLLPFGLIYPRIGISSKVFDFKDDVQAARGQLSLEILDVSGKPLECKFCDLELLNLNKFSRSEQKRTLLWEEFRNEKLDLKVVQVYGKCETFSEKRSMSDSFLVRELPAAGDSQKDQLESCEELFESRVLEILGTEMGEVLPRKSIPVWQILLSFLYREGYCALVSLSDSDGKSRMGILKPFTVSSALLSIVGDEIHHQGLQYVSKPYDKLAEPGAGKTKKNKVTPDMLQELTWSAFCKAALEHYQIHLEDIYFARRYNKAKKLKFLKCWMKEIKKSGQCSLTAPDGSKTRQNLSQEADNRLSELPQECEQPIASCASAGEDSLTGASRIQDEAAVQFQSENSESFFTNLPHKIKQGLETEEVDLGSLAQRLVDSSIYWLYQKCEKETNSEGQNPVVKSDDASSSLSAADLAKLLLREPKDLATSYRSGDPSSQASSVLTSDIMVREYELQILFRLEILQSEAGASMGESTKQKFVKQICLLLETIQCRLKGGFFGDWSLDKYVAKIIKSRYCDSLGEVVHRIYEKMDLLLFADEDESPNPLLNSEDSNQSWREKQEEDDLDENNKINQSVAAEDESFQPVANEYESPPGMNREEHARKLLEAQERRQRARRFASFTSWVPDLQRVWAPKQPKAKKPKSNPLGKLPKKRELARVSYDTVCETPPMTGEKHSGNKDYGTTACGSVYKALFQDDQ